MTPRQKAVLDAVRDLTVDGVAPTFQEIADRVRTSKGGVHRYIEHLEAQGLIIRGERRDARTLRVVGHFDDRALANLSHHDLLALRDAIDARLNHRRVA